MQRSATLAMERPEGRRSPRARDQAIGRLAWSLWALTLLQVVVGLILAALNGLTLRGLIADFVVALVIAALSFATVGALIIQRQPGNPIGWLLCLAGFGNGAFCWLGQYAQYSLVTSPGALPGGEIVFWFNLWAWPPVEAAVLLLLPLLFPTGRLPSARWRPLVWLAVAATLLIAVSLAFGPNQDDVLSEFENPFLLPGATGLLRVVSALGLALMPICLLGALAAPVSRFRRAQGPERQQLKWFAFGATLLILGFTAGTAAFLLGRSQDGLVSGLFQALAFPWVPIATGVAILRYRLYDIDLIINRTLVYVALTACVVGIYVFGVGYLGTLFRAGDNRLIALVVTGLVAVLFQPLREQVQRGVNRLLYGERDEPYTVLTRLGQRLAGTLAPEDVLATIVGDVARALKLPHAAIWLADGAMLRLGATSSGDPAHATVEDAAAIALLRRADEGLARVELPAHGPFAAALAAVGAELALPLAHGGTLVGALCLAPRRAGESFSVADRRLLRDLASHAGAAAQAVQLTVALRASLAALRQSRERLVTAQEEERRRIQRDLHDGLGPILASMRLRLEACLDEAQETAPALARNLERLHDLLGRASADIRRLVYDLRPPALDQLGLLPTLREYADRFGAEGGLAVTFTAEADLPIPAVAEVAILRVVQEALVNVQKHARASQVCVDLRQHEGWLLLAIRDDGVGLPAPGHDSRVGTGLASMRERVDLLGGSLEVASPPTGGTALVARIPLRSEDR